MEQFLSGSKFLDITLPMTSGVSGDNQELRFATPDGGEVRLVVRKSFVDATGRHVFPNTPLYRTPSDEFLSIESIFECTGCFAFFRLIEGHEIQDPPPQVIQVPEEEDSDSEDVNMLAFRLPAEGKPRHGYCGPCWKKEKRRRTVRALIGFFRNPLKSMFAGAQHDKDASRQAQVPQPVVLLPGSRNGCQPGQSRHFRSRNRDQNVPFDSQEAS